MRIIVKLETSDQPAFGKDYRRYFLSFIKKVFSQSGTMNMLYKKMYKPYVYSVWLGNKFEFEEEKIQAGPSISVIFSSGMPEVVTSFYNGVLDLKDRKEAPISGFSFRISKVSLLPPKKINYGRVLFRTIGVSVLNNTEAPRDNIKRWFIIPTDNIDEFNKHLSSRTNSRYQFITQKSGTHKIKMVLPSEINTPIKETIVKHYGGNLRGFRGSFWLEGTPEILQFVYDYGLGIRTGQGFGMLEIVKMGA